jgi:hypothetical protein
MTNNEQLVADNFQRFLDGDLEGIKATWSEDSQWHGLNASSAGMTLGRDDYFSMLASFADAVPDYGVAVKSVTGFGEYLVLVHLDSWGTGIQPGGGLVIYRIDGGEIVANWVVTGGADANAPF